MRKLRTKHTRTCESTNMPPVTPAPCIHTMGTRNIVCVYYKDKFVIAQYEGHNGYPAVTGVHVLKFLTPDNMDKFKDGLQFIRVYDGNEMSKSGSSVLDDVANASERRTSVTVGLDLDFASDSLFCEWAM